MFLKLGLLLMMLAAANGQAQSTDTNFTETVQAILPAKNPLPPESESAGINRFSFVVYGDTRGRRDGKEVQYEHSLIIDSMLEQMKKRSNAPVRFVLQSGDAVVDGRNPKQWNNSFVGLINRLSTNGGVPYFLAPGNHDVTSAAEIYSTNRAVGLRNYLGAVQDLIPMNGNLRRLAGYPSYAFAYGNSFFLALDSNIASDAKQYYWAEEQLEGLDRRRYVNVFAFFHHPPFSSGSRSGQSGRTGQGPSEILHAIVSQAPCSSDFLRPRTFIRALGRKVPG